MPPDYFDWDKMKCRFDRVTSCGRRRILGCSHSIRKKPNGIINGCEYRRQKYFEARRIFDIWGSKSNQDLQIDGEYSLSVGEDGNITESIKGAQ